MKEHGGEVKQPYGYTGREWDKELGLYYYRARYYDPKGGRFISKDPIGFEGGDVNLYRYVKNQPVDWIDPSGLGPYGKLKELANSLKMPPMKERVQNAKDFMKWKIDSSGLKEILNAPPCHPIMWEKDALWWMYGYWPGAVAGDDVKFFEPWGHPFFGGHP
jgi:RHS repeat-associated protein